MSLGPEHHGILAQCQHRASLLLSILADHPMTPRPSPHGHERISVGLLCKGLGPDLPPPSLKRSLQWQIHRQPLIHHHLRTQKQLKNHQRRMESHQHSPIRRGHATIERMAGVVALGVDFSQGLKGAPTVTSKTGLRATHDRARDHFKYEVSSSWAVAKFLYY
ncbi:hypothetical protein PIIN_06627 [Serendipita indica DSM 11827]|uniref:Uncharacterized protein n=1 Tax=Serendipita indica (strain DSM 11827) TaxID=1109443 RepID=G4TMZ7_SERID|nr:hypothetical protein PIIN_06627 [Serendipita indica DSM 11827]